MGVLDKACIFDIIVYSQVRDAFQVFLSQLGKSTPHIP
jgi:hypothetical protein